MEKPSPSSLAFCWVSVKIYIAVFPFQRSQTSCNLTTMNLMLSWAGSRADSWGWYWSFGSAGLYGTHSLACTTFPSSQLEPGHCCVLNLLKAIQNLSQHQFIFHWIKIILTLSVDKQILKQHFTECKELQVYSHVNVYRKCCSNSNFRK